MVFRRFIQKFFLQDAFVSNSFFFAFRYAIHACDVNHAEKVWENRATYIYYTELGFELATLFVDFFHHLHMLVRTDCNSIRDILATTGQPEER